VALVGHGEGEQLLQLVDDQQGAALVCQVGQRPIKDLGWPLSRGEHELPPPLAARQRARGEGRQEPGAHQGGLAAA
jgi:hypothetical protein